MRYPASEKLEIIRLVEESHLSARVTLAKLGIPQQSEASSNWSDSTSLSKSTSGADVMYVYYADGTKQYDCESTRVD